MVKSNTFCHFSLTSFSALDALNPTNPMKTLYNNLSHVRVGAGNNTVQLSDKLAFKGNGTPLNRVLIFYDNFHTTIFFI
jgi:hypothetical protein